MNTTPSAISKAILLSLFLIVIQPATAGIQLLPTGEYQLTNEDGSGQFGFDIDGDTAVANSSSGDLVVYIQGDSGGWAEQNRISRPPELGPQQSFGGNVKLSGNTMVVTTPNTSTTYYDGSPVAYVYVRDQSNNWSKQAELIISSPSLKYNYSETSAGDEYITSYFSVAIDGDTIILGSSGYKRRTDNTGNYVSLGAAFVFVRDSEGTWTQQAQLHASDSDTFDYSGTSYGQSVDISGDYAIVGAYRADASIPTPDSGTRVAESGTAYIYERDQSSIWTEVVKINPGDLNGGDDFGWVVAMSGNTALISAPDNNIELFANGTTAAGAAYIYDRNNTGSWIKQAKLYAPERIHNYSNGSYAALDGNHVVLTGQDAYDDSGRIQDYGERTIHYFLRTNNTWSSTKVEAGNELTLGRAFSVANTGDTAILSGILADANNSPDNTSLTTYIMDMTNTDGDEKIDIHDDFPNDPNKTKDADSDNDGIGDIKDNCPSTSNSDQANTDDDLFGNACDTDDDNDGLTDIVEESFGSNPLLKDTDGDGYNDLEEYEGGSDPNDANSVPKRASWKTLIPFILNP